MVTRPDYTTRTKKSKKPGPMGITKEDKPIHRVPKSPSLGLTKKDLPIKRRTTPSMGVTPKDTEAVDKNIAMEKIKKILNKLDPATNISKTIRNLKKRLGRTPGTGLERPMGMAKKGGTVSRKAGGTVKKQVGGLPQGYNARLDESLAARHPAVRGNLAARAAESRGEERALGRRPFAGVRTMDRVVKKGGSVRRKKGSTVSRKGGGKIMQGYKAGGKV